MNPGKIGKNFVPSVPNVIKRYKNFLMSPAGGAWIVAIKGFAGLRMNGDSLHCNPALPEKWKQIRFRIIFRGELYEISVTHENAEIKKIP